VVPIFFKINPLIPISGTEFALTKAVKSMKLRVLLIDDDSVSLECVRCALRLYGFEVTGFQSPDEAIAYFSPGSVDVVVTDYNLDGTTGTSVIKQIHQKQNDIPVIVISGGARKKVEPLCLNAGAAGFFSKPLDIGQLAAGIISIIKKPKPTLP
jgi:DNA-binding NtrC family response regulator